MSPYEILSHTEAVLKIKAVGETKEEMFSEMLRGVFESAGPQFDPEVKDAEKITREVSIKSANQVNMLVEFLNEAIFFGFGENEAYMVAEFQKLTETELKAVIYGHKVKDFQQIIKSAFYNGAKIEEKDEKLEAVVILDI